MSAVLGDDMVVCGHLESLRDTEIEIPVGNGIDTPKATYRLDDIPSEKGGCGAPHDAVPQQILVRVRTAIRRAR